MNLFATQPLGKRSPSAAPALNRASGGTISPLVKFEGEHKYVNIGTTIATE